MQERRKVCDGLKGVVSLVVLRREDEVPPVTHLNHCLRNVNEPNKHSRALREMWAKK